MRKGKGEAGLRWEEKELEEERVKRRTAMADGK